MKTLKAFAKCTLFIATGACIILVAVISIVWIQSAPGLHPIARDIASWTLALVSIAWFLYFTNKGAEVPRAKPKDDEG